MLVPLERNQWRKQKEEDKHNNRKIQNPIVVHTIELCIECFTSLLPAL